jgi:histidinol-phosphatase (PHP family)
MLDAHVHLEGGEYTLERLRRFTDVAQFRNIDQIYLLEHSHRFIDFLPIYESACKYNEYQGSWLKKRLVKRINEYCEFVDRCRNRTFPVTLRFGIEICYFQDVEKLIEDLKLEDRFDFLTGSVHWIDDWGFDHRKEHWKGKDIDSVYARYFQTEIDLINTGIFDIIAHPDSIKCFGYRPSIDIADLYQGVASAAQKHKILFEQSCGLANNYGHNELGLDPEYLKILIENGIEFVTASDAHRPEDVGKNIEVAEEIVRKSGGRIQGYLCPRHPWLGQ